MTVTPDRSTGSPHSNPNPPSGQGVVIHATRSGISQYPLELEATLNWFANPTSKVSSHWVIGRNGEKVRVIPDNRQAWHAGQHNATHWGIELCQGDEDDGFTYEQMAALIEVCRDYVALGVPATHGMAGFIGHDETPQGRTAKKSDPGYFFNWSGLINGLSVSDLYEWRSEGEYMNLYRAGIALPVFRIGGELPGQISKLFGTQYQWLVNRDGVAMWEPNPGD